MNVLDLFNLSYSTYSVYKASPLQFYFQKISKPKPTDWVPEVYGMVGNFLHFANESRINDKTFNGDDYFVKKWYEKNIDSRKGLFNTRLKQPIYLAMVERGIKYVDHLHETFDSVIAEERFDFEFYGIHVKGFIDVVAKKGNEVHLLDWKSDSANSQAKHELQRLFYSWAYYKVHGIIPVECKWVYLRKLDIRKDSFTLEDLDNFEIQLKKDLDDIKSFGTDIQQYPIGNFETPFNCYKTLCLHEQARRDKKLKFGFATWGNYTQLVGNVTKLLQDGIDKKLSYEKKLPEFVKSKQNWDGFIHLFRKGKNVFPTGLQNKVSEVIKQYAEYVKTPYSLEYKNMRHFTGDIEMPKELVDVELRDYQNEAVEAFLKQKYGVIKLKTGLGKTFVASEIIRRVSKTTLWIINRKLLAQQTQEVLSEVLGVKVGLISEGKVDIQDITVCTYQTLVNKVDELHEWLEKQVGFVVCDEVHGASSKSVQTILSHCKNTEYRLGLSATPFLREDALETEGLVGGVIFELAPDDERNKEFLSDCDVTFVELKDKEFSNNGDYNNAYDSYIINNKIRNEYIKEQVDKHKDSKILIITKALDHAKLLGKLLDCPLLIGDTADDERAEITKKFKSPGGFVCVGSYQIISEGYDIPMLDGVIQVSGFSSDIKSIQGLGRGLRKAPGKDKAFYIDFVDKNNYYLSKASKSRQSALEVEGHNIVTVKQ